MIWDNPVFQKEIRLRLPKHPATRIGLLVISALFVVLVYFHVLADLLQKYNNSADLMWEMLVWAQFLFILFAAPTYAANAFSKEREQQTWDLLFITPLTAQEIVFGKLLGRLSLFLLVMLVLLPLEILLMNSFLVLTILTLLLFAFFCTALGLYASWALRRTLYAQIAVYTILIGVLSLGTLLLSAAYDTLSSFGSNLGNTDLSTQPWLWFNPFYLFALLFEEKPTHFSQLAIGLLGYALVGCWMVFRISINLRRREG